MLYFSINPTASGQSFTYLLADYISNLETIALVNVIGERTDDNTNIRMPLPIIDASGNNVLTYTLTRYKKTGNTPQITFQMGNSMRYKMEVDVILRYTKTTDSAISIGNETDYSTTEKAVGTWIDGKIVYQKTALVTLPIANALTITNTAITGIDVLVATDGEAVSTNGWTLPIFGTRDSHVQLDLYVSDTGVLCFNHKNDTTLTLTITAQYTKTTD